MKNSRNTVPKTEILKLIHQSPVALSHTEIQTALNGLCDRVTIYRVLERLITEDEVHKVVNLDGVVKYAACHTCTHNHVHTHNHAHFSCETCKEVTCLENIEPSFKIPSNYQVKEMNFTLSGICPNCR
jgi:Fur family ferric uptake transcriptional regulator